MIIKEILLDGFGKFDRKHIEFAPGLNVVYAKNEAGKTTIRKSIEAALYGFANTESKRKNYYDDYNIYKSGAYRVKLNLTCEDGDISIERDLSQELARVYSDHRDISSGYTYVNKILAPGLDILGVDSSVYREFFDIDSNNDLDNALIRMILNADIDSDFASKIILLAESERSEIGSLNAPTKQRAIIYRKILDLKEKIRSYKEIENEIKSLKEKIEDKELAEVQRLKSDKKPKNTQSNLFEYLVMIISFASFFVYVNNAWLYLIPAVFIILSLASILRKRRKNKVVEQRPIENKNENEIEFYKGQLDILEKYMDEKLEDIDRLERLTAKLEDLDYEYKLLTDLIDITDRAQRKRSASPINKSQDKSKEIFKFITASDDLFLDKDFNSFLDRGFKLNKDQMSTATKEIVNFSTKMALRLQIMEGGFILLDDAFQYLDDFRLANTVEYLTSLCQEGFQIIVFTSNKRILDILEAGSKKYKKVLL